MDPAERIKWILPTKTGRGRGRARGNNENRQQNREPNHEGAVDPQGPNQRRADDNAQRPGENGVVAIPDVQNLQNAGNGGGV